MARPAAQPARVLRREPPMREELQRGIDGLRALRECFPELDLPSPPKEVIRWANWRIRLARLENALRKLQAQLEREAKPSGPARTP